MVDVQSSCKKKFPVNSIAFRAHLNEHGGEKSMANKNNGNQPTNANNVRQQNQQSEMKKQYASGTPGTYGQTEFGTETDVTEVKRQNQQSAQKKNGAANRTNQTK